MLLENNLSTKSRDLSSFKNFFGNGNGSILTPLQKFGEISMTTNCNNLNWAKLANQGTTRILAGFANGHSVGTYWVFNLKTQNICLTKNLTFLNKSYDEWNEVHKTFLTSTIHEGSNDEEFKWFSEIFISMKITM